MTAYRKWRRISLMNNDSKPATGSRSSSPRGFLALGLGKALSVVGTLFVLFALAWAGESRSGPLIFAGSGPNLPIIRLLAEAFARVHPEIKISVPATIGSGGGIRAAAAGAIAVGLTSRPLKEQEQALGLTVLSYARTAVVLGTHPTVADDGISSEELVQIYKGARSRWRDGREIIVLTREPGDSLIEVLDREVPGFTEAYTESHRVKGWATLYTDVDMHRVLTRTPYALGLSNMGAITAERLPIKVLHFNAVQPTPENVRSGRYPLVMTLAFVFLKDKLTPEAKVFLDFVRSRDGQKILRANNYLPLE